MLSVGQLLWASFRPLIRLVLCVACGFVITKSDNFPAIAARGAGQIILNIALPCLMFSKIVPAFTSDNVGALGPLILVAVIYESMGVIIALLVKRFFWVPHRFRHGILVAGGWGNVGDIPTSVVMSIAGAAPFNGTADQTLSVAYISAFILVFFVTLFPCGGHRWIMMDYIGPDVESEEVKKSIRVKRKAVLGLLYGWVRTLSSLLSPQRGRDHREDNTEVDAGGDPKLLEEEEFSRGVASGNTVSDDGTNAIIHGEGLLLPVCNLFPTETGFYLQSPIETPEPTVIASDAYTLCKASVSHVHNHRERPRLQFVLPTPGLGSSTHTEDSSPGSPPVHRRRTTTTKILTHGVTFLKSLISPASIAILFSFPIALIPPLKALFVTVPSVHLLAAPDGLPPLAFFFDTTTFIGAASVPLGLICLGSALARLNVPRDREGWRSLPIGAITAIAIGKMMIMPVLGVLLVHGLVQGGVIPREDKVLRFVCIFCSCLPTATTQVFLTQVYSGTGTAEHLSAFLIPQYLLMFVSMTALTAYTLQLLF